MAFAILSVKLHPSLESAADFAADAVGGRLGRSLEGHRRGRIDGLGAFEAFSDEWRDLDPSLPRAVALVGVAIASPTSERAAVLERALDAVLDGSRERVSRFATTIRGPAMGIYAFGVMLPLALVGLLPVLATTGGGVPMVVLAILYDLLLPLGLVLASVWLAARRPAVATPSIDRTLLAHGEPLVAVSIAVIAAFGAGLGAPLVFPPWTRWIVGVGTGIGSFLVVFLSPVRREQERIDALERGLPDAVQIAGRQLGEGIPLETAIGRVGQRVSGPTADLFQTAATVQARLGTTVRAAFSGEHGALAGTPSARAATVTTLLAQAGEYGQPGAETIVAVGEYLERLQQVEREARRELAQTTSTLRQTAVLFAPIIAGVTVALATGMDAVETPGKAIDVALLGQVIGTYVLILGIILPGLAVILERGFDPVRVGYRSGIALVSGSLLYPLAFLAARTLVYV